MTLACGLKEVFEQDGFAVVMDPGEVLAESLSLVESLSVVDFACRLKATLFETMLSSLLKGIITVECLKFCFLPGNVDYMGEDKSCWKWKEEMSYVSSYSFSYSI